MSFIALSLWFLLLAFMLFILLKSADYFVDVAQAIGKNLGIPEFIIGATIVAFGTSLPELAVGIASLFDGNADNIIGIVLGSNISNILFITGMAIALSSGFLINLKNQKSEFAILFFVSGLLAYFLWNSSDANSEAITLIEGVVLCVILIAYIIYILKFSVSEEDEDDGDENIELNIKTYILFGLSVVGIWIGAEFTALAIAKLALGLNLGSDIIAQTVVALGTSLPELAVTLVAVKKLRFKMVMGNVIGSNIFNILCVIGIPAVIGSLFIGADSFALKDIGFRNYSLPFMLAATLFLMIAGLVNKTPKFVGILMILLYISFIVGSFIAVEFSFFNF